MQHAGAMKGAFHCRCAALCLSPRFTCEQASSFVGSKTSRTMLCGKGESPLRLGWPQAAITLDVNSLVNTCRRYADMQKRLEQEQADEVNSPKPLFPLCPPSRLLCAPAQRRSHPSSAVLLLCSTLLHGAGCNSTQAAPPGARRGRHAHAQPSGQPGTHAFAQRPALQCSQADPSALEGTVSGASRDWRGQPWGSPAGQSGGQAAGGPGKGSPAPGPQSLHCWPKAAGEQLQARGLLA